MISRDLAVTYVAQNSSDNPLSYNNSVGSYVNTGSLVSSSPVESDLLNINNNNHLWTDLASPAQVQTQPPGFPAGGGQNVYSFMVTSLLASQPIYFSNDQLGFLFSNATPPETNPLETLPVGDYNNQPYGLTSGTPSASSLGPAVNPGVYLPFQNQFSDGGGGSGNGPYSLNYNYVSNPMTADFYGNLYALGQAGVYEYNSGASVNHSTLTSTSTSWSLVAPLTSKNANPQLLSDLMLSYSSTASPAFGKAQAAYSLAVDTMGNIDLLTYNNHLYQYSKSTGAWVSMAQPNPIPTNICGAINLHGLPGNCSNFPNVNLVADSSGDVFYLANFGPNQPVTGAVYEYLAGEAAGTAPVLISTGLPPASDYLGQNYPGFLVGNDGNIYLQASSEVRDPNNPNINGIYELDTNTNPAQWVQVSSNFLYVPINGVAYSFNLYSPSELAIDSAGSFYGLLFSFNTQTVQVVVTRALIAPTALKNK